MKIIDCEFHYYLPELMEYLSTRDNAMRYYPESKIFEVRDNVFAHFDGVTNEYPVIDELMNFGAERVAVMDKNGIDVAVMSTSPALEELPEKEAVYFANKSNDAVALNKSAGLNAITILLFKLGTYVAIYVAPLLW